MDRELQQNKRLREMFRFFQRSKKLGNKTIDQEKDEEQPMTTTPTGKSPPSPRRRHSKKSAEKRRKQSVGRKKLGQSEDVQEDENEAQPSPESSVSEKKRQAIRKKYGILSKDEEFFQRARKNDVEEFETVNVTLRPAATKMRQAKLRWKRVDDKQEVDVRQLNRDDRDLVILDGAYKPELAPSPKVSMKFKKRSTHDEFDKSLDNTQSFEEEKEQAENSEERSKTKDKSEERICKLLKDITKLLSRISDLEQSQQKDAFIINRLTMELSAREKKISELKKKIALLERKDTEARITEGSVDEDDKPTSQQEAIALRGLAIMKRNQILEQVLKPHEAHILSHFFQDETLRPNKMIVKLIDKAFAYGIEVLLMRPDLFEDVVDNELRLFMLDSARAKRIFLDCMLLHPEYVPISWGGDVLAKRQQLHQIFTQKAASKSMENERVTRDGLKENREGRNSRTQTALFHRKSPASKSSREAVKDVINRSLSPTVEEEKGRTQDFDFIKADGYENEGKFLQREVKQEKVFRKKIENTIQESADARAKPMPVPTNQIPNQRTLGQNRISTEESGRRMSRNRKPKLRSGKRRDRTGNE